VWGGSERALPTGLHQQQRRASGGHTLAREGRESVPFSGTLELLRLLEDHTARRGPGDDEAAPAGGEDR
jgi:hypothetical protein